MAATFGIDTKIASDVWELADALRVGEILDKPQNQFGAVFQVRANATTPTTHVEKAAAIFEAEQEDSSTPEISKDLVAVDARATIRTGNLHGRVWGGFFAGHIRPGGDGNATGIEIGIANNGSDQPEVDKSTSKVALTLVAEEFGSTGHVTAAVQITRWDGRPRFYHGIVVREDAFVDGHDCDVILLIGRDNVPSFRLKPDGSLWVRDRKIGFRQVRDTVGNVVDALILEK